MFATVTGRLQERGHKQLDGTSAVVHFILLMVQLALGCITLWPENCTAVYCCRALNLLFGVTYALVASQLIMAHMCKEPFNVPMWTMGFLSAAALNGKLQIVDQAMLAYVLCGVTLVLYLHWVVSVIGQICGYLDISCLSIKKKKEIVE